MKSGRTPTVVLEVRTYGESDKIVTFYSKSKGRMSGIAKGAQRSLKRFVNKLELFSHLEILYTDSHSSSLARIDQAELINPFPVIRSNYDRFTAAALICELILHWTRENDPDERIFWLLIWALTSLEDLKQPATWVVILFNIKLLTLLGYKPALEGCSECGTPLAHQDGPYRFNPARNGLICRTCGKSANNLGQSPGFNFSISTARFLSKAQEMPLDKLARLRFSPTVVKEALLMLKNYGSSILQRDISSWNFLVK
ncbi:MAG: DNA repair protein RecO [Desulfobulbaceae bacterium]|nr:DNA repair protein RecO [Desulfobulbaceae bacterium]